jgi:hypothetical protein
VPHIMKLLSIMFIPVFVLSNVIIKDIFPDYLMCLHERSDNMFSFIPFCYHRGSSKCLKKTNCVQQLHLIIPKLAKGLVVTIYFLAYRISVSAGFTGERKSYLFPREKILFSCYMSDVTSSSIWPTIFKFVTSFRKQVNLWANAH